MRPHFPAVALLVSCSAVLSGWQAPARTAGSGRLLSIDAVALDEEGMPVTDLRPGEIEIWIGGLRIPIKDVVAPPNAGDDRGLRSITLLIDDITLAPISMVRAKEAARRLVRRLSPEDRLAVLPLSGGVSKMTSDRALLERQIEAMYTRATALMHPGDLGAQVLATLERVSGELAEDLAPRRTVIGIGNAVVFDRPIPPPTVSRSLRAEWASAMRAIVSANVTVYVIDPGGVGGSPVYPAETGLAHDTGGRVFVNTNDIDGAVERILRETATYYTIEVIDPPRFRGATFRELDVRTSRSGVTMRARRLIAGKS